MVLSYVNVRIFSCLLLKWLHWAKITIGIPNKIFFQKWIYKKETLWISEFDSYKSLFLVINNKRGKLYRDFNGRIFRFLNKWR